MRHSKAACSALTKVLRIRIPSNRALQTGAQCSAKHSGSGASFSSSIAFQFRQCGQLQELEELDHGQLELDDDDEHEELEEEQHEHGQEDEEELDEEHQLGQQEELEEEHQLGQQEELEDDHGQLELELEELQPHELELELGSQVEDEELELEQGRPGCPGSPILVTVTTLVVVVVVVPLICTLSVKVSVRTVVTWGIS